MSEVKNTGQGVQLLKEGQDKYGDDIMIDVTKLEGNEWGEEYRTGGPVIKRRPG